MRNKGFSNTGKVSQLNNYLMKQDIALFLTISPCIPITRTHFDCLVSRIKLKFDRNIWRDRADHKPYRPAMKTDWFIFYETIPHLHSHILILHHEDMDRRTGLEEKLKKHILWEFRGYPDIADNIKIDKFDRNRQGNCIAYVLKDVGNNHDEEFSSFNVM